MVSNVFRFFGDIHLQSSGPRKYFWTFFFFLNQTTCMGIKIHFPEWVMLVLLFFFWFPLCSVLTPGERTCTADAAGEPSDFVTTSLAHCNNCRESECSDDAAVKLWTLRLFSSFHLLSQQPETLLKKMDMISQCVYGRHFRRGLGGKIKLVWTWKWEFIFVCFSFPRTSSEFWSSSNYLTGIILGHVLSFLSLDTRMFKFKINNILHSPEGGTTAFHPPPLPTHSLFSLFLPIQLEKNNNVRAFGISLYLRCCLLCWIPRSFLHVSLSFSPQSDTWHRPALNT